MHSEAAKYAKTYDIFMDKSFKNALLIDHCDKISEVNFTSVYTLVIYYINVCGNKLLNCKCVKKVRFI